MVRHVKRPRCVLIAACLSALAVGMGAPANAAQVDVAEELARLASANGFTVTGDEHLQDSLGRAEGDAVYPRVRLLLERFDHIILQRPGGGIERVIVLGKAMPGAAPPRTVVQIEDPGADGICPENPIQGSPIRRRSNCPRCVAETSIRYWSLWRPPRASASNARC
jgi:hypothetical protein